jgi:hypothetical protein
MGPETGMPSVAVFELQINHTTNRLVIFTLGRGALKLSVAPQVEVAVDNHPQSCPNPLNVRSQGVLPVAILGTSTFDVTQVDVATVQLKGVPLLLSALEDVATPFVPFIGKKATDCTAEGPDGFLDLTLKFDTQAVVAVLGRVTDGEARGVI